MTPSINHDNYTDAYLNAILTDVVSIAVVGASARPERDSNKVMRALLDEGYQVFPVNPTIAGQKIHGRTCYASLDEIGHTVDMVDVFRASEALPGVVDDAIKHGARVVWMQLGLRNDDAARRAESAGIRVVMNRCPKQEFAKPYWIGRRGTSNQKVTTMPGQTALTDTDELLDHKLSEDGVLRLTLNDQKRRNALSEAMLTVLATTLEEAAADSTVRVIVLAATGPAFCAGHDLKEISAARSESDKGKAYFVKLFDHCASVMQAIVEHPKPIIAEVAGVATAAGCQLVASCDLAVAGTDARFATPGVNIGLFCSTPMVALSRNVSRKQAMEMLLTGEMIDAPQAERIGLVNRVVESSDLSEHCMQLARTIAGKSSMTLAVGKQAFYRQAEMSLSDAYVYASQVMVENMLKHDAEEGINAFVQKRSAKWQDE